MIALKHVPGLAGYGFSDSETARGLATRLRDAKLLDNAPMLTAKWPMEHLIVECRQLYWCRGIATSDGLAALRGIWEAMA